MPSSKKGIQGPRPNPLRITKDLQKTKKSSETPTRPPPPPTIFYEHTPKVIHTSPQEFMGVVQQLTGRSSTPDSGRGFFRSQDRTDGSDDAVGSMDDSMLLLTLGRRQNLEKASSSISPSLQFSSSPSVVQYSFQKQ